MPIKIIRYKNKATDYVGWAIFEGGIYSIDCECESTQSFLNTGLPVAHKMINDLSIYEKNLISESDIDILSPITAPCRILCQGSNYPQSRIETGMNPNDKSFNTLFHKSDASISSPNAEIISPSHVRLLDYEVELGIVIGTDIHKETTVTKDNIHKFVAGIVLAHDVTARDIQIPQGQYFKGKSYRTFCPLGPYLCILEKDEFNYIDNLELKLFVNGELRQADNSKNLIYSPSETISELSQVTNLTAGDLLLTGSPGGGALKVPSGAIVKMLGLLPDKLKWKMFINKQKANGKYLKHGDEVISSISSADGYIDLGTQRNRVRFD
ncbi:fumarylacetoacetate hydrolase family protein [Sessilibacter corallicola]|uniref:Fumarylacetoacetate hydrolase family protein n=1 Tax=Sessilibacter corallicola TaxID=2904075 RepID=A0ABQ0A909_9GAMM